MRAREALVALAAIAMPHSASWAAMPCVGQEMEEVGGCSEDDISEELRVACAELIEAQGRQITHFRACSGDRAAPECSPFRLEMIRAETRAELVDVLNILAEENFEPSGMFLHPPAGLDRLRTTFAGDCKPGQ